MDHSHPMSKRRRGGSPGDSWPVSTPVSGPPRAVETPSSSLLERLREQVQRHRTCLKDTQQAPGNEDSAARPSVLGASFCGGADSRGPALWTPPASPWGLLEEMLYADPWRLLVACILLNRTTGRQVRGVLGPLWRAYPTPQAMAVADETYLSALLRPLGFHNTRAVKLKRFSHEFISKQWGEPTELHGVGSYAADAYAIFYLGQWRDSRPTDKDLRRYVEWLEATGGEGTGLERESLEQLLQPAHAPDTAESGAAAAPLEYDCAAVSTPSQFAVPAVGKAGMQATVAGAV